MSELPSQAELQKAWDDLRDIHTEYLQRHSVKIPNTLQYNQWAKSIWLAVLHFYKNTPVHKDKISEICQRDHPNLGRDQQVRHLKRDGWKLTGSHGFHQLDPYQPSLEWINKSTRREGRLKATTFDEIKNLYGNKCATCGAREGRPDTRYGQDIVTLQQGHLDPSKPAEQDNIIPQCQFCNRAYRRDFVFDDKGRVHAVADIGPVQRAALDVKKKILKWLDNHFSNNS